MTVAKIYQRYQRVARASAARPRHAASAVAGVSVEIKRIGQAIDSTQSTGHYLVAIHGFDLKKLHRYRLLLYPQVVDSP